MVFLLRFKTFQRSQRPGCDVTQVSPRESPQVLGPSHFHCTSSNFWNWRVKAALPLVQVNLIQQNINTKHVCNVRNWSMFENSNAHAACAQIFCWRSLMAQRPFLENSKRTKPFSAVMFWVSFLFFISNLQIFLTQKWQGAYDEFSWHDLWKKKILVFLDGIVFLQTVFKWKTHTDTHTTAVDKVIPTLHMAMSHTFSHLLAETWTRASEWLCIALAAREESPCSGDPQWHATSAVCPPVSPVLGPEPRQTYRPAGTSCPSPVDSTCSSVAWSTIPACSAKTNQKLWSHLKVQTWKGGRRRKGLFSLVWSSNRNESVSDVTSTTWSLLDQPWSTIRKTLQRQRTCTADADPEVRRLADQKVGSQPAFCFPKFLRTFSRNTHWFCDEEQHLHMCPLLESLLTNLLFLFQESVQVPVQCVVGALQLLDVHLFLLYLSADVHLILLQLANLRITAARILLCTRKSCAFVLFFVKFKIISNQFFLSPSPPPSFVLFLFLFLSLHSPCLFEIEFVGFHFFFFFFFFELDTVSDLDFSCVTQTETAFDCLKGGMLMLTSTSGGWMVWDVSIFHSHCWQTLINGWLTR